MSAGMHTAGIIGAPYSDTFGDASVLSLKANNENGVNIIAFLWVTKGVEEEQRANALRLAACWNALAGLSLEQVERLGKLLGQYNGDEVEDFLRDEGV